MVEKINLQGTTAITMAHKVAKICAQLRNLDIAGFQYMRRLPNGHRYILCDRPELMQLFYEEGLYPLAWYDNDEPISSYQSGIEFWPIKSLFNTHDQASLGININKLFNINHSVTYLEKTDKALEIFRFFSSNNLIYLLDCKVFCHFIFYFKEHMHKSISQCHQEYFKVPLKKENSVKKEDKENHFLKVAAPVKKYYLKGKFDQVYLTDHERNYIHWCAQGKSSEEVGIILGISKRTVENSLYKIKEKLNCYKLSQLITIAIEQGIVSVT